MKSKLFVFGLALLLIVAAGIFAESIFKKHQCAVPSMYSQTQLLVFEGKFESFEETASPHVLDQDRREMMRFECEDMPVLFYISPDASFIRSFSPGQKLKISGYQIGQWDAGYSMIVVQTVEEL